MTLSFITAVRGDLILKKDKASDDLESNESLLKPANQCKAFGVRFQRYTVNKVTVKPAKSSLVLGCNVICNPVPLCAVVRR